MATESTEPVFEPVALPPAMRPVGRPRLTIFTIMIWTALTAILLALNLSVLAVANPLHGIILFLYASIFSTALLVLGYTIRRAYMGERRRLQPGEWLGCAIVAVLLPWQLIMLSGEDLTLFLFFLGDAAKATVCVMASARHFRPRRWRYEFQFLAVATSCQFLSTLLCLATIYSNSELVVVFAAFRICSEPVLWSTVAAMAIVDFRQRRLFRWRHWAGLIAVLMMAPLVICSLTWVNTSIDGT